MSTPTANPRVLTQPALAELADVPATSVWVRSGEVRLHLLDYGPADAVPLVVLPGITSPAVTMDFVARELTDLVRPLVLDVRGRGLSDDAPDAGPLHGYHLDAYAADVDAVIEQLRLPAPILLGHSMGARIAARSALSGRVAGTVLVDPPMSGPGRPYPTTVDTFAAQLDQARRGTDADEVAASWPRWPRREQELRAGWLASCSATAIAATHAGFESEEFLPLWEKLTGRTALLFGSDSPVVTAADVAGLGAVNPVHPLVAVEGAGHMVFWDQPGPALQALRAVLKDFVTTAR
ncbi:alpha/beta hydrolase [Amycolatopsis ultiminotia]|uniref:Alpha/beta hydrolase n=1 Tax=Amycolatopsis ultiminotia TaxID=543629 RepID=A0ABP6YE60_9PSEU